MFQDQNGAYSSKRIAGSIILLIGLILLTAGGILSLFKVIADSQTFLAVCNTLMFTGAGLLGIGVVEFFKPKKEVDVVEKK